jgi:hypothetical protein
MFIYRYMSKAKAASEDNKYKIHRFLIYEEENYMKKKITEGLCSPSKEATK